MHELSVASAVVDTASRHANGRQVTLVSVRVGRLRQVVPDSLRFYFAIVARDTVCEHARLALEEVDVRMGCTACGRDWEPRFAAFRCPDCAAAEVIVLGGEELEVQYIEVQDAHDVTAEPEEAACIGPR